MPSKVGRGRAPGKAILFGEHFVVAGNSAIAMAINLVNQVAATFRGDGKIRVQSSELGGAGIFDGPAFQPETPGADRALLEPVKVAASAALKEINSNTGLNVSVEANVPISVGLGSSASVAVATIGAVASLLDRSIPRGRVFALAFESERLLHGNPSGIDQMIVLNGGIISYQRDRGIKALEQAPSDFSVLIGNTKVRRSTGTVVARVLAFRDREPGRFRALAEDAAKIVAEAQEAIIKLDYSAIGRLMDQNQRLLVEVGASSAELDKLITAARASGAFGAKLTGAGGGGCMITVADDSTRDRIVAALREFGADVYEVYVDETGLDSWQEPN